MMLRSLTLSNFHRFDKFSIDFDDHLTVLVGDNGSGKSSILRAASIALSAFLMSFEDASAIEIKPKDARLVTYSHGEAIDRKHQFPVAIEATGIVDDSVVTWTRALNSKKGKTTRIGAKEIINQSKVYSQRLQAGDTDLVLPLIAFYGTGRLWANRQVGIDDIREIGRTEGYRGSLDVGTNDKALLEWFMKASMQEFQIARRSDLSYKSATLSAVRQAVASCFSLISGCDGVTVEYNPDINDLDIIFRDEFGEVQSLPRSYFSDGYKTALSMVADIAYRMAVLNPGLEGKVIADTPGIVLIDEVDLHLHPKWQARVLSDLRKIFPRIQFIVTTHAPLVISSVRKENVRLLEANEPKAIVPQTEVYGGNLNRLVTTIMGSVDRPEDVQSLFGTFYRELDNGRFSDAKNLLDKLAQCVGDDEPEMSAARTAYFLEAE